MGAGVFLLGSECKWAPVFLLLLAFGVSITGVDAMSRRLLDVRIRMNYHERHAVRSIQVYIDLVFCLDPYLALEFGLYMHAPSTLSNFEYTNEMTM